MSRSTRHTPIGSNSPVVSEKHIKRLINRRFRRKTRLALLVGREPPIDLRQICDVWDMGKDGKSWVGWREGCLFWEQFMRK
jgi:hypothetical protein